jgi:hypothetical protein
VSAPRDELRLHLSSNETDGEEPINGGRGTVAMPSGPLVRYHSRQAGTRRWIDPSPFDRSSGGPLA